MNLSEYGFTKQETIVFEWQFGMMGGFMKSLMECIKRADAGNLLRLSMGFPDYVTAYEDYTQGDMWQQLTKKMDAHPEVFARFKL